ncbi:hypothetical protein TNCV_2027601 [Trichonephila clavipes]|nr:hypothetical protein TNCV_2027601 [Trichonephila clavipes]
MVPEFLRSTSCKMTSARGHGAIVYCLNSGSEDSQTGHHNEGERKETEKESGEREEPALDNKRGLVRDWRGKTMNARGVENGI